MNQNNSNDTKKLNIAIVQAFDKNIRDYAEYSRLINAMYAYQKGYTYISFEDDLVPVHVSAYYNKILAIQRVFSDSRNFDWILYLDSDAVITNFSYDIEDIIKRHPPHEIIIPRDPKWICSGTILVKNTTQMSILFTEVYSDRSYFHTRTPEESALVSRLFRKSFCSIAGFEEAAFLNAYLDAYPDRHSEGRAFWNENSFVLHLFGLSTQDRINMFKKVLSNFNILCISNPAKSSRLQVDLPQVGPDPSERSGLV
jgi:hypothetical protein